MRPVALAKSKAVQRDQRHPPRFQLTQAFQEIERAASPA